MRTVYDYVIVGAGSAGCVLAARLSEDRGTRVLVLEAGPPDDGEELRIPAAAPTLLRGRYDWDFATVPQRHAGGRVVSWPRGRTLGGSSSTNAMIYIRGHRADYDTWRDAYGCAGWGYADLLPYFRRAEDQQRGATPYHGVGGPLRVEDPRYVNPLNRAWVESARGSGLAGNDDFAAEELDGVGYYQLTQRAGRRWSAADAYLRPAARRDNLVVADNALVTRLIIENGRAAGVRYRQHGRDHVARAGTEVVLAGGAVNTPQLLMLSGIGPAGPLRSHGIDVVVDSPAVGTGLQDHPLCVAIWRTPGSRNLWEETTEQNLAWWRREGQGPMASVGAESGGFARTRPESSAPDVQFHVVPAPVLFDPDARSDWRGVSVLITAVDVASRGVIRLRSADPAAKPLIDPAYLAAEADLEILVAGLRQAREIARHAPLADLVDGEFAPGEAIGDDTRLRAWIRRNVATLYHPTSSCAMGAAATAACDPQLRVRGVDRLRVADASAMPAVPRGNTNAPTIALAERAADLIRGDTCLAPARLDTAGTGC